MVRQLASISILGSILLATVSATPFGTIDSLGQRREHEMITRAALACKGGAPSDGECFEPRSIDNLAGKDGTFGAVGSPDTPPPEGAEAHCDDADFLNIPGYPQTRAQATARLLVCVNHLRTRFRAGITDSAAMLNDKDQVNPDEVDLEDDCTFGPILNTPGRAKCEAMEELGRSLHGVQDFYAHSNYGDAVGTGPFTTANPPGVGQTSRAGLLDLRATGNINVAVDLSTGCFGPICLNRIRHGTMNKDHGLIDPNSGATSDPTTPRGMIANNFGNAVALAIQDSRRQWQDMRDELKARYGDQKANLMICILTRDDPVKDCQGRKIAIVVDSSGSNTATDPSNLRINAAQQFNDMLVTQDEANPDGKPDLVTVIDFDSSARILYPLGDPSGASFDGIDSSGGTFIAGGVSLAIDTLMADTTTETDRRTGIVVLTDGEDSNISALLSELARAATNKIRVAFGFLAPPADPTTLIPKRSLVKRAPGVDLLTAILKTGGIYSEINSAEAQQNFGKLVIAHGATDIDSNGGAKTCLPGLTIAGLISEDSGPKTFRYRAKAGEKLSLTTTALSGQSLSCTLRNIRANADIETAVTDGAGVAVIALDATADIDLELIVTPATGTSEGVFTVGLKTTAPTIATTSSAPSSAPSSSAPSSSAPSSSAPSSSAPSSVPSSAVSISTTTSVGTVSGQPTTYSNGTTWIYATPHPPTYTKPTGKPTGTNSYEPHQTPTKYPAIITTYSVTRCPITITKTYGAATECITSYSKSTVTYVTTLTAPCSGKCPGSKPTPTISYKVYPMPSDINSPTYPQHGGSGEYPKLEGNGEYPKLEGSGEYPKPEGSGEYPKPEGSGEYPKPEGSGKYPKPEGSGKYPNLEESGYSQATAPHGGEYPKPPEYTQPVYGESPAGVPPAHPAAPEHPGATYPGGYPAPGLPTGYPPQYNATGPKIDYTGAPIPQYTGSAAVWGPGGGMSIAAVLSVVFVVLAM